MKIAYLLLIHDTPQQAILLIKKICHPDVTFFLHLDSKMQEKDKNILRKSLPKDAHVFFTQERVSAYRYEFSLIEATQYLIGEVLKKKIDFEYAFLLSGSHYPIKTHQEIINFLEKHKGGEFIENYPLPSDNLCGWDKDCGLRRVEKWHFFINIFHIRRHIVWPPFFLGKMIKRKIPEEMKIFGGAQWWCLSKKCLIYLEDFYRNSIFEQQKNFFRHVLVPDEIYYQTVIMNSTFRSRVNSNSLVYIDWSQKGSHPKTLKEEDFEKISQSSMLFARKFDISKDASILKIIDKRILGKSE